MGEHRIGIELLRLAWGSRTDQYGWTAQSTQLFESRRLKWGSILFHYGALAATGGHVLGILVPVSATEAVGISDHSYHVLSATAGTAAGGAWRVGLLILRYAGSRPRGSGDDDTHGGGRLRPAHHRHRRRAR